MNRIKQKVYGRVVNGTYYSTIDPINKAVNGAVNGNAWCKVFDDVRIAVVGRLGETVIGPMSAAIVKHESYKR